MTFPQSSDQNPFFSRYLSILKVSSSEEMSILSAFQVNVTGLGRISSYAAICVRSGRLNRPHFFVNSLINQEIESQSSGWSLVAF